MDIEKAKENLKRQLIDTKKANKCGLATKGEFKEDIKAIETVLNELEYKQDDINVLQAQRDSVENQLKQAKAELEKKDKIIDEMAKYIVNLIKYNNPEEIREVKEIKQYFTKKVEKGE